MHLANLLFLPFYLLPFYLLRTGRREDLEEGNSHFGYWEGEESIAHCKSLDFTFLPFTFLPFEVEDGAVSRTDTETPGARASCDGLGAPSDS